MHLRYMTSLVLVHALLGGCASEEPASRTSPSTASSEQAASSPRALADSSTAHEPWSLVFWNRYDNWNDPHFTLSGVDRPFRVSFNWISNGTPLPSLYQLIATSPSGVVTTSDLSDDPLLEYTPPPGETTVRIDIDHYSRAPQFLAHFLVEQELRDDELGACGDQARDLFLRWVHSWTAWRNSFYYPSVQELSPSRIQVMSKQGVGGFIHDYRLLGVLDGTHGPILQVQDIFDRRLRINALLFHDRQGQLLRRIDGLLYGPLPDGNLLVSSGMANDGNSSTQWAGVNEAVMSVTLGGDIVWSKHIGGRPPGHVVVTQAGNYVMPWSVADASRREAGAPAFDPRTGADVAETFVDRGAVCTQASTSPECAASRDLALEWFQWWWDNNWWKLMTGGYPSGQPYEVCDRQRICVAAVFTGWVVFGDEDVLEIALNSRDPNGNGYRNFLLFTGDSALRRIGGKIIRRLGPDRLLISTAMADSGFVPRGHGAWYAAQETLSVLGPRGVAAWKRTVGGQPALLTYRSSSLGSNGFLLPSDRLFWAAWDTVGGQLNSYKAWLDLTTGALLPEPPKPTLVGACRP